MEPTIAPPPAGAATTRSAWPMTVLTSLFFMWGFMTVLNDVLVPHWKKEFTLTYAESIAVQFCFFTAYFVCSLIYFILSMAGLDLIGRMGYKRSAVVGLIISAIGCALFIPAAKAHLFGAFLFALFILGCGFAILQIAANPFVALIGHPDNASSRLNLAQAFNSLGTTIAPILGGWLLFDSLAGSASLIGPYTIYAVIFVFLAAALAFTGLPEPPRSMATSRSAFRHPQLRFGMIAIFCYVGAEVAVGSWFISFANLPEVLGMQESEAKFYLSLYWGGAMCGRFMGAVALVDRFTGALRTLVLLGMAAAIFLLLAIIHQVSGGLSLTQMLPLVLFIAANMAGFLIVGRAPSVILGVFACAAAMLCAGAMLLHGSWALWCLVGIGLFNSVMWSNIFTLAIDGLKEDTAQGSSLLVMMIVGGAVIPKVQGYMADSALGLQLSFIAPLVCYAYLAWYGFISSAYSTAWVFDKITNTHVRR